MLSFKNVIIIGGGGNLGSVVLKTFLHESSFNVTVLSREGSTSEFPPDAKVIRANYDSPDALKKAFQDQDVVVSLVGGAALGDQNKFIDAAIAAGVKRFIPSEYGCDTSDARAREIAPILNAKFATANYLRSKESAISWTAIITGPFWYVIPWVDWGNKVGFLGFNVANKTATLWDNGTAIFSATNLHTIALGLIKVIEKGEESANQYVYISSFNTSQKEMLAGFERLTGSTWAVTQVSSSEQLASGRAKLEKGDFSGIEDLLKVATFSGEEIGRFDAAKLWNDRLGLPKDDFEKALRAGVAGKYEHEV
ncbi:hypothetical protein ACEQ8H_005861 [Pleosporales sp. CAS-2024a]